MIVDAHLHCSGDECASDVMRTLDAADVDVGVLLAPFLSNGYTLKDSVRVRAANQYLASLVREHRDRLIGFGVVNPTHEDALDICKHAIETVGLRGLKMVPSGWYPYDECAHRVYEYAARWKIPVLFHSGIFIDGQSGRFCRPVFFEAVREHPGLRVTLAHLGWPWCDEANAVGLIDLINGVPANESQFRFDISFGPPPIYRKSALKNALEVLTPDLLQFGSDRFFPCTGANIADKVREVSLLFDSLRVAPAVRERVMSGTARAWLNLE